MAQIISTNGHVITIDDEDLEYLSKFKWYAGKFKKSNTRYARSVKSQGGILMHRLLLKAEGKIKVDHKDGNGLNNVKENLRLANDGQSARNKTKYSTNTSGHKGVHFKKDSNRWIASICIDYKVHFLGYFDSPEEASEAYKKAAKELHGDFAKW